MHDGWKSRADEEDYIADTLHGAEEDIKAAVDRGAAPEEERSCARVISENAERYREEARRLRLSAEAEAEPRGEQVR